MGVFFKSYKLAIIIIIHARFLTTSPKWLRNLRHCVPYTCQGLAQIKGHPSTLPSILAPVPLGQHSHEKIQQEPSVPLPKVTLCSTGQHDCHIPNLTPLAKVLNILLCITNQFRIPRVILGSCPQNTKINTCSNTLISSVSSGVGQVHISGYGLFYKALELGMAFTVLKRYGNKGVCQKPGTAKA